VVLVRHARELYKPSGTARVTALAMPELELIDYRDEPGAEEPSWLSSGPILRTQPVLPPEAIGARLRELGQPHLLFPTGRPLGAVRPPPSTIVVLDGTWRQARSMFQRIPGLSALPSVRLDDATPTGERLRRSAREGERSTLEAIADAIALLEGEEAAAPLRRLHARFVEAAITARWGPGGRPA
jgi:DTW domain-containing protein